MQARLCDANKTRNAKLLAFLRFSVSVLVVAHLNGVNNAAVPAEALSPVVLLLVVALPPAVVPAAGLLVAADLQDEVVPPLVLPLQSQVTSSQLV